MFYLKHDLTVYITSNLHLLKVFFFSLFQMSRNPGEQPDRQQQQVKHEDTSSSYSPQGEGDSRAHVYSAPGGHYRHYASPPPPPVALHHHHQYVPATSVGACALEGCVRYAAGTSDYCSEECRLVAGDGKDDDEDDETTTNSGGYNNSWPSCMVRAEAAGGTGSDLLVK